MIPWLTAREPFPPVEMALTEPAGLLAAGADLSVPRLIDAYSHGIFPWFNEDQPILWWSTDPRMVLFTEEFRTSHSLKKRLNRIADGLATKVEVRCDTAFADVIRACAMKRPGQQGTWITPMMIAAYERLHDAGFAHSIETWIDGRLAGGLYGIALGRMFYGESMFARATDASKIALATLVAFLKHHEFPMIDCQQETAHLASLGARPIPRSDFTRMIKELVEQPGVATWPRLMFPAGAHPRIT